MKLLLIALLVIVSNVQLVYTASPYDQLIARAAQNWKPVPVTAPEVRDCGKYFTLELNLKGHQPKLRQLRAVRKAEVLIGIYYRMTLVIGVTKCPNKVPYPPSCDFDPKAVSLAISDSLYRYWY